MRKLGVLSLISSWKSLLNAQWIQTSGPEGGWVYCFSVSPDGACDTNLFVGTGGVGELYSHTPRFSKDEEVLVFVKKDNKNNLIVAGGNEGKFKVTKDELTGEKMLQGNLSLKKSPSRAKSIIEQRETK